uniref:Uncharacterized protein n=1 Tax=Anguilla anguilla TaxID=7936 RepID=A0A0E9RV21_ANGAN
MTIIKFLLMALNPSSQPCTSQSPEYIGAFIAV